ERLESWKEIAVYLRRGVSTVQRWEQQEGLPVHRLPHAKKGSIFANKCELEAWWRARAHLEPLHQDAVVPSEPRRLGRRGRRAGGARRSVAHGGRRGRKTARAHRASGRARSTPGGRGGNRSGGRAPRAAARLRGPHRPG